MNHDRERDAASIEPVTGHEARRKFLRTSGKAAVAAPAAALLLAAMSKNAAAQPVYTDFADDA